MPSITGSKSKTYSLGERNPVVVSNGGQLGFLNLCIETLSAKETNTVRLILEMKKAICASSCGMQKRSCSE